MRCKGARREQLHFCPVRKILNLGDVTPPSATKERGVVGGEVSTSAELQFRQLLREQQFEPSLGASKADVKQAMHESLHPSLNQGKRHLVHKQFQPCAPSSAGCPIASN